MTPQRTNREAVATSRFDPLAIREGTRSLDNGGPGGACPKQVLEILLAWSPHWAVPTRRSKQLPPRVAEQTVAEAAREVPIA